MRMRIPYSLIHQVLGLVTSPIWRYATEDTPRWEGDEMGPENANVPKDPLQLSGCPGNDTLRPSDDPHASKRACRNLPNRPRSI